eukprot:1704002-Amphidinium_carterae.2
MPTTHTSDDVALETSRRLEDCKGVILALRASQHGHRHPKFQKRGKVSAEDSQGNQDADTVANLGAAGHDPQEPSGDWLHWEAISSPVRHFWVHVAPKLRERPEVWPRVRQPTLEPVPEPPPALLAEVCPSCLLRLVLTKMNTQSLPEAGMPPLEEARVDRAAPEVDPAAGVG